LVPFESDAIAWLDAFSLIDDGLVDGDPVTNWTATINPVNGSAVQTGVGLIPTLDDDVDASGKPGVVFNGSSHYLLLGDGWKLSPTSSYTTYFVVRRNLTTTGVITAFRDDATNSNIHQLQGTNGTIFAVGGTASAAITSPTMLVGERRILSILNFASPSSGFRVYINGSLAGTVAANLTNMPVSTPLLGARWVGPPFTSVQLWGAMTVQSLLVYNTEHDATARATVLAFLYSRYGVVP
jgi:hypothetical protein